MPKPPTTKGGGGTPLGSVGSGQGFGGNSGDLLVEQWDRKVRYYKLTSSDVWLLGFLGLLGSIFLTIGGAALGLWINLKMSAAFATLPLTAEAIVYKDTLGPFAGYAGLVCCGLGMAAGIVGAVRFWFIKRDHVERVGSAKI